MSWLELIDGFLWIVALPVSVFLGWEVYRRRDLPARLFLGMVMALVVLQVYQLAEFLVVIFSWLSPGSTSRAVAQLVRMLWPVDVAALVTFGCLTLHLFLVFPTKSRLVQVRRWSPLLFYFPGVFLVFMVLSHMPLGHDGYMAFWGLARWGIGEATLQYLFVVLVILVALVRLTLIYFSRATPLVRQQLTWIFWGFMAGGGLAVFTDYLPRVTNLPRLAGLIPGLEQLPTLIILGSFALSIVRYHIFDVVVVVNRSLVYSTLMVAITLLYLGVATALGGFFRSLAPDMAPPLVAVSTTLIVVLIALPLRDAIQQVVDRLFWRRGSDYGQLLQDYSRVLTTVVELPRLLSTIANQVEEVMHPSGLAIALAEPGEGYQVTLSRGAMASDPSWQEGTQFAAEHFISVQLKNRHKSFCLPWHAYDVPPQQKTEWQRLVTSGVRVLVPLHLHAALAGWLVLGPKISGLAYAQRDLDFLCALADQSCVALEKVRLYSQMQRRARELAMLGMVSSAISSHLDLERVLETIVESVVQVIGCAKSAIFELSEDGGELVMRMSKGLTQRYIRARQRLPVDTEMVAKTIARQQPTIIPDVRADPILADLAVQAEKEGFRALIDVPLVGREGVLGILTVYYANVYSPTQDELEILTTFAEQATIAIENARLYAAAARDRDRVRLLYQQTDAALARRVEELTFIEEISRQLTSTLDLQQVMDLVLERALQATQAHRGVIALYEPDQHGLRLLVFEGYPLAMGRYRMELWPADQGIAGRVARTGTAALVSDVSQDPDYAAVSVSSRSQLSVPVVHEGQTIGVITVESDQEAAFTAEHLDFVQLLAEHAAIGIHNAKLFQEVMEARDRLQAILNSTHDAVIMLDGDGHAILVNSRVRAMLGPTVENWLRSINMLDVDQVLNSELLRFTDLDLSYLKTLIHRVRDHQERVVGISFSFQSGAQRRFVEGTTSPVVNALGQVIGRVVVLRDVSRRRELEQFREDLISMMIHDLQGPLAALITSLEILRTDGLEDSSMTDELLRIALTSGQRLHESIESLMTIRRLEEKQMPMDLRPLPLPSVVQMVVDECMPVAASAGVSLETDFTPDLPLVLFDEGTIVRVFSNLLDNALRYTSEGGRIQIQITSEEDTDEPFVLCSVSDSGSGIAEELTEVIFEKFRQGEPAPDGRRKGMGIGLYYCKLAVEAHGGRIWVESEKGRGATFYFTLPLEVDELG